MSTFLVCPQFVTAAFQHGAHAPRELASAISRGALGFRNAGGGRIGALSPWSLPTQPEIRP